MIVTFYLFIYNRFLTTLNFRRLVKKTFLLKLLIKQAYAFPSIVDSKCPPNKKISMPLCFSQHGGFLRMKFKIEMHWSV